MAPIRFRTPALRVSQWLPTWNDIKWNPQARQARPADHYFVFSLPASSLLSLSQVRRRKASTNTPRSADVGIQRYYDQDRAEEIRRFVDFGYPWSQLKDTQRRSIDFEELQKPGWLPTAILVNVLEPGARRGSGPGLLASDAVSILPDGDGWVAELPEGAARPDWNPAIPPIEVIDGQHRLWAFENHPVADSYELPVVAFVGLDISWQAYLFWTINITPRRINASLAFDLIPLLRTEEWLDRFAGHQIYREARAQEMVEALWAYPKSPWFNRINLLGEPSRIREDPRPIVSQAAWIRSLMATYVRRWDPGTRRLGGLFGAPVGQHETVLPWSRTQQAAFLSLFWIELARAVQSQGGDWADQVRTDLGTRKGLNESDDPALYGQFSLLSTDQGIRGAMAVSNDVTFVMADELDLFSWRPSSGLTTVDPEAIDVELSTLRRSKLGKFIRELAVAMARYDWRTGKAPSLAAEESRSKLALRGSGGYRLLREDLLKSMSEGHSRIGSAAAEILEVRSRKP